jgi:NAD(P)H-hydrate epimerase
LTVESHGLYKESMEKYTPDKKLRVMSREEVRAVDSWAIEQIHVPGVVLMENAGRSCAELIREKLAGMDDPKVCIFCGTGNNGGDGYVIARHLLIAGIRTKVILCADRGKVRGDAQTNLEILERLGHAPELLDPTGAGSAERVTKLAGDADMIVDALFGTGLQGELKEPYRSLIEAINALRRPIVAVDIPSGLDCDTGEPLGTAIRAAYTVTFVALKRGFVASSAARYTGEVYVASIGVEPPAADP